MGQVWFLERPDGAEFGTIYGRELAVKTFNVEDETEVTRELCIWASLDHNSIVPLIRIARLDFRLAAMMPKMLCGLDALLASEGAWRERTL